MSRIAALRKAGGSPFPDEPLPFTCDCTNNGQGTSWVRPCGELDFASAPELEVALTAAQAGARLVVLDLGALLFIDSSGVHLILDAGQRAADSGRRLVIVGGSPRVREIFALTGTTQAVDVLDLDVSAPALRRAG
ncbi:MAG: anti-anti-sigma factor [Solirubrobacteraceae bacterium]|nr:anti-anti-sigma factor [Solirubrobacteraceae bacterium]